MRWQHVGVPHGRRSLAVLGTLLIGGALWLGWPVWDSLTSPSREQAQAAAPMLMTALISGLVLLGVSLWLDAGRRAEALAPVATLVVLNTIVRAALNPQAAGVEFVFALPLLAGVALGAPSGFLVGAGSCLLSTAVAGDPASTLPSQALVWGCVGAAGGLLWRLRPVAAWLAALPLAVLAGLGSGMLLNLMGWAQETGTTTSSFFPGLPAAEVLQRLWSYTLETSVAYDLTRGATTMLVLAIIGLPSLRALRPDPGADRGAGRIGVDRIGVDQSGVGPPGHDVHPDALARREDRARLDRLWTQGD